MPLITMAIPTYNNATTICRAIDSCLNQSLLNNTEVLVVNNASTDNTANVLRQYGEHIRVVTNQRTVSLFENHNVALTHSNSQYTLFCHSDDALYPEAIDVLTKHLSDRGQPRKYICWGHSLFRDFYPALLNAGFTTGQAFAGIHAAKPFLNSGLTPSGTCYSKEFLQIGGFLPTEHRLAPSDATSMINAALHGFTFEMLQSILFHRTGASTLTRSSTKQELAAGFKNAFDNLLNTCEQTTIADLLSATLPMNRVPYHFIVAASKHCPKVAMARLIRFALNRPQLALTPSFLKALVAVAQNYPHARKD